MATGDPCRAGRARRLRARLPAVVRLLVEDFGARRVVLSGSLLHGEQAADSDIDMAVAGLRPASYWKALARLVEAAEVPVDLVLLEDAPPTMARRIAGEGELLHGRTSRVARPHRPPSRRVE